MLQTYIAYYASPQLSDTHISGVFEFQSEARAGSKANLHDARLQMLENYGSEAVSWIIESVEKKKKKDPICDQQLAFDFREPVKKKRPRTKKEGW